MLNQINTENALAEQQRQFNENLEYKKQQDAIEQSNWERQYQESIRQYNEQMEYKKQRDAIEDSRYSSSAYSYGGYADNPVSTTPTSGNDTRFGNSEAYKKDDYYFDNNQQQPRYINNIKLSQAKVGNVNTTAGQLGLSGMPSTNKIWTTGDGQYWVWVDKNTGYINVTDEYKKYYNSNTKVVTSNSSAADKFIAFSGVPQNKNITMMK